MLLSAFPPTFFKKLRMPSFYLPLYGSKLGSEINMKEAQTRDVRVSSKGQGGWEKERARGGCAVQKDFLVGFVGHSLSL
jgi:hypothetical protein